MEIRSGGQTGVDRAALDAAIDLEFKYGGWCNFNRATEDGTLPEKYKLFTSTTMNPKEKILDNVKYSDGTLIISPLPLKGEHKLTADVCKLLGTPYLIVNIKKPKRYDDVVGWIKAKNFGRLHITGPSENSCPNIYNWSYQYISELLNRYKGQ